MPYSTETKLSFDVSIADNIFALTKGNIGAIRVCTDLFTQGGKIDPQNAFEGFGPLLNLDSLGIYNERIWMLYKDVCGQDYTKMVACLRAVQMGIIPLTVLDHAIDNRGAGVDTTDILAKVQEQLPQFGKN